MKNRYEGLIVLNTKGGEDSAKEIIEKLEKAFKKEGAEIEQVQKMGSRPFSYAAGDLSNGYYVNFVFQAEPAAIDRLRTHFKLDTDVYRQTYMKLGAKKAA
jgi:small subunit ribosomal protein S6